MVHLTGVPNDKSRDAPVVEGLDSASFFGKGQTDGVNASVYGSRFAAQDLPWHEMPEDEMPKDVAYRLIK